MAAIFYIIISVLLNVGGQLSLKVGTRHLSVIQGHAFQTIIKSLLNGYIFLGLCSYVVSSGFWIVALSKTELSYAYPFLSLGYILVVLFSYYILHEHISAFRITGIACIIVGLIFIAHA